MATSSSTSTGQSSLLAQDGPDQLPSLGGGGGGLGMTDLEDQRSPLEELIARSSEEQRLGQFFGGSATLDDDDNNNGTFRTHTSNNFTTTTATTVAAFRLDTAVDDGELDGDSNVDGDGDNQYAYSPYATLAAGTLCLLQAGLVWGSFLSTSWFDTHLLLTVELPVVKTVTDEILHSTTLASLLSDLLSADQQWAATALMVTSLIVPCLSCVCGPYWTVTDRKDAQEEATRRRLFGTRSGRSRPHLHFHNGCWELLSPRLFVEYTLRVSFVAFFLLAILNVGTSSMEINTNMTRFVVNNRIRGGLASYALGMTSALLVILILRAAKQRNTSSPDQPQEQSPPVGSSANAPPYQAFQLPWRIANNDNILNSLQLQSDREDEGLQTPLLTAENSIGNYLLQPQPLQETGGAQVQSVSPSMLPFWKRAILYEFGTLSTLLWFPALFLPLFELTYDGIIADFMTEVSLEVRFWEFPAVLWQRGVAAGTDHWIMVSLESVLIGLVYVGPLLATILSLATWNLTDSVASAFCQGALGTIQPCLCSLIFCLSLHLALPAFEAISEYAIDMGSSGLCQKFSIITSDTCLRIQGHSGLGLWFLFAQSTALEIFVILTLAWKEIVPS